MKELWNNTKLLMARSDMTRLDCHKTLTRKIIFAGGWAGPCPQNQGGNRTSRVTEAGHFIQGIPCQYQRLKYSLFVRSKEKDIIAKRR